MSGLDFVDYTFRMHQKGGHVVNFQAARFSTSGDPTYNAWLSEDGSYVISEHHVTNGTIKYYFTKANEIVAGTKTLDIDWANKTNLTYEDYNALFV